MVFLGERDDGEVKGYDLFDLHVGFFAGHEESLLFPDGVVLVFDKFLLIDFRFSPPIDFGVLQHPFNHFFVVGVFPKSVADVAHPKPIVEEDADHHDLYHFFRKVVVRQKLFAVGPVKHVGRCLFEVKLLVDLAITLEQLIHQRLSLQKLHSSVILFIRMNSPDLVVN